LTLKLTVGFRVGASTNLDAVGHRDGELITATLSHSPAISTDRPDSVKLYRMSMPEHECPWGLRAVDLLNEKGIPFKDIKLTSQEKSRCLQSPA